MRTRGSPRRRRSFRCSYGSVHIRSRVGRHGRKRQFISKVIITGIFFSSIRNTPFSVLLADVLLRYVLLHTASAQEIKFHI